MADPSAIRILIVDDQASIRSLIRASLHQLGFTDVVEAPDGEEGLRVLLTRSIHLVISDFNMPKLDGLALLRAIRSHPPIKNVAFVMLTGRADRELVQRAVQFGVNNFLVKPFTVATLKQKVEEVVGVLA